MQQSRFLRLLTAAAAVAFVLVAAGTVRAGFFDGKTKFYTLKTPHFRIHYSEGLGGVAQEMSTVAEGVHDRMTKRLMFKPKRRTDVVLTDKSESANGVASVLPDNSILLYVAIPTPDSTLDHYRDYYEFLFTHEYTHILHIDETYRAASPFRFVLGKIVAPNGATPGWMREGMAVYEESLLDPDFGRNNSAMTEMYLRTSYYEEDFPRIDQIAGLGTHYPGGIGAYLYGGRFFDWLSDTYGEDRMYSYQKEYASSLWLYALNNKARRVYGKSFYKLWREFRSDLALTYDADRDRIQGLGLTEFTDIIRNENSISGFTPHPGGKGYAWFESGYDEAPAIVIDLKDGSKPHRIKRRLFGQMSFSKNGRYLAFAALSSVQKKTSLADVYYYDTKTRKLFRAAESGMTKKSMRAMDPDFSPADGGSRWLVMTRNFRNTDQLYVFDLFEKRGYVVTDAPRRTQFSTPRFSPDGQSVAVSRKDATTGRRDIVVYSKLGQELYRVTDDVAPDLSPVFSPDGRKIYFSSARSGVFNIHEYDITRNTIAQTTNVLTGVFQPMPGPYPGEMFVQAFATGGYTIRRMDASRGNPALPVVRSAVKKRPPPKRRIAVLDDEPALARFSLFSEPRGYPEPLNVAAPRPVERPTLGLYPPEDVTVAPASVFEDRAEGGLKAEPTDTDSLPVVPVQTGRREPQTAPRRQSHRVRSPKEFEKKNEPAETKVRPSAYKDALTGVHRDVPPDFELAPGSKKYTAFPHLLRPTYLIPNVLVYESAVLTSLIAGKFDPLYRHSWTAFVDYRSDAKFVGGGGTYVYTRYDPSFYVGGLRYVVDWGTLTTLAGSTRFFEERWQAYTGVGWRHKFHSFNWTYFYEHRSALTQLAGVNLINMKPYAGLKFQYAVANYKKFPDSVSQEDGYLVKTVFDYTDDILLSNAANEETVAVADARYYFEMPWADHHVLALRVAGGWQWGDIQQFGTFRLGGPLGEGSGAAKYSSRVFPMRGLAGISYGGDRAFIFSAEYRLPLVSDVNLGIGTWPVFLDKLHMDFFVDGGDIKYRTELPDLFTRLMIAPGAELKGDFVLGYGLPITARIGYGIILMNRSRVGNLTDSITGASLRYGSTYIQVGTSF